MPRAISTSVYRTSLRGPAGHWYAMTGSVIRARRRCSGQQILGSVDRNGWLVGWLATLEGYAHSCSVTYCTAPLAGCVRTARVQRRSEARKSARTLPRRPLGGRGWRGPPTPLSNPSMLPKRRGETRQTRFTYLSKRNNAPGHGRESPRRRDAPTIVLHATNLRRMRRASVRPVLLEGLSRKHAGCCCGMMRQLLLLQRRRRRRWRRRRRRLLLRLKDAGLIHPLGPHLR